jgi:hypothetical protein
MDARRLRSRGSRLSLAQARIVALGRPRCAERKHAPRSAFVGLRLIGRSRSDRAKVGWLDVFPGMQLDRLPRPARGGAALRAHLRAREKKRDKPAQQLPNLLPLWCARSAARLPAPLPGTREAPHASPLCSRCARSAARFPALLPVRAKRRTPPRSAPGTREAPHASPLCSRYARSAARFPALLPVRAKRRTLPRRARGRRSSRMPGTKTSDKSWKTRSRSAKEMEDLQRLTEQAPAFHGRSASGPAPPSERAQTKVSSRAPKAPRVPQSPAGG